MELLERKGIRLIVHLPEEVDHHHTEEIRRKVDAVIRKEPVGEVEFDFSGTEFMDSSGIGVILNRYKQMEGSSGTVAVYGAGERMRRILRIGGVHRLVQSYRTREEALDGRH